MNIHVNRFFVLLIVGVAFTFTLHAEQSNTAIAGGATFISGATQYQVISNAVVKKIPQDKNSNEFPSAPPEQQDQDNSLSEQKPLGRVANFDVYIQPEPVEKSTKSGLVAATASSSSPLSTEAVDTDRQQSDPETAENSKESLAIRNLKNGKLGILHRSLLISVLDLSDAEAIAKDYGLRIESVMKVLKTISYSLAETDATSKLLTIHAQLLKDKRVTEVILNIHENQYKLW